MSPTCHGHDRRESQDVHGDQYQRQRPRLAPPGHARRQPRHQRPPDTILFKIPGTGPFTIAPLTPLPTLDPRHDHQRLQPAGAQPNTSPRATTPSSRSSSDGANVAGADGLAIAAGGSTVKGLAITGFTNGIHLTGSGARPDRGRLHRPDARRAARPAIPAAACSSTACRRQPIGGTAPAARDIISANGSRASIGSNATGDRGPGQLHRHRRHRHASRWATGRRRRPGRLAEATIGGVGHRRREPDLGERNDGIQLDIDSGRLP